MLNVQRYSTWAVPDVGHTEAESHLGLPILTKRNYKGKGNRQVSVTLPLLNSPANIQHSLSAFIFPLEPEPKLCVLVLQLASSTESGNLFTKRNEVNYCLPPLFRTPFEKKKRYRKSLFFLPSIVSNHCWELSPDKD